MTDKQPKNYNLNQSFRLRDLLFGQMALWCIAWVLGIATVLSVLGLVMLSGWFITMASVVGVVALASHAFNYMMPSAIIRTFAIVRTFARYGDLMVSHHAVFGLLRDLRVRFFARFAKLPLNARLNKSSAQTMQRLVKDIDTLDEFPLRLVSPLMVSVVSVVILSLLLLGNVPTSWVSVLFVVLSLFVAMMTLRLGVGLARRESDLATLRKTTLLDTLPALTALLTWGRYGDKVQKMSRLDDEYHALSLQAMSLKRNAQALIQIAIALAVVALLLVVGRYFEQADIVPFSLTTLNHYPLLNPAIVLALVLGVFGLMEIIMALLAEPLALGRSMGAKQRVNALAYHHAKPITKTALQAKPSIVLRDLAVQMPSAIMGATNINATLGCDKPVLIVGASGAGKSTLLATLAGEIMPTAGQILVNDCDHQTVDFGNSLGFLGQNVDIFDQTLADNLRLGKPSASDDELWAVLEQVNLATWAKNQPKGLNTPLGEYGMAISGGQGRRVALARLLLEPKAILLLDEPFAGLDVMTRQKVWQSLTTMQQAGKIGILAIATHQIWDEMADCQVLCIG